MVIDARNTGVRILSSETVSIYTVSLREDWILHAHISKGGKWNPKDYDLLFPIINQMVDFKTIPLMVSYDKFVFPTAESSAYWAKPVAGVPSFCSVGIITDSLPLKVLGNFYINYKKPRKPTRLFENQETAAVWLRKFL